MPDIRKILSELKADVYNKSSTDPKVSAEELHEVCTLMATLMRDIGLPRKEQVMLISGLIEDHLTIFKSKVQEELLESQRTTNDALAAALNMSGERKAEKK